MAKFKKMFLSAAMLLGICVIGGGLTTHAAPDGLFEDFVHEDGAELGDTNGSNAYNVFSQNIIVPELAKVDDLDVLKLSHQPGDLAETGGKVEIRDNGEASSLFNTPGASTIVQIKFKMNQTEDKSIKFWFGGGDVNASGKTYNMLRMRYNETRYQMGTASEVTDKTYIVTANAWHVATFVLYEAGEDVQDKVYTYVDNKLIYSADFNTGDDFNGKLTGITLEWPRGTYSSASEMLIDYVSVQEYNGATASCDSTKSVTVGQEFEMAPTLTANNTDKEASLPEYNITISDTTKLDYNEQSGKFTALAETEEAVTVTFDYVDELIEDKTVAVTIEEADEPIKVASINQALIIGDIHLSIAESFKLNDLFKASPVTADDPTLAFEVVEGNDVVSIENDVLTGLSAGTATIKALAIDGSNVEREVTVKVSSGAYANLNNFVLEDTWTAGGQTVSGFTSVAYSDKTFAAISVREDSVFGNALYIEGNGGKDSSGSHMDKYISVSDLSANKNYKFSAWIKLDPAAAGKTSATSLDLKFYAYHYENGRYSYGALGTIYANQKQNSKADLVDGWIYVETPVINLDTNAIGYGYDGIKIEVGLWKGEEDINAYITHLALVEIEGVEAVDWNLVNEHNQALDTTKNVSIQANSTYQINAVAIPSAGTISPTFASSNETIATVDENGLVTILDQIGTVTITITVGNSTKEITFDVTKSAESITLDTETINIILHSFNPRSAVWNITVTPADSTSELVATVDDEAVCTVTIVGNKLYISEPALGSTTVTISAVDNPSASFTVVVNVKEYTVTYDVQGHGTAQESVENVLALPAELPTLEAEGYIFGGWYLDAECTTIAEAG
ncbi:MAG: InlB B-repeat-containing protein, partial [Anaeroplasmataceae bacterium]|nr:InlB B-repeat-containing protein [Anaeroplasmataceae bacterium]